MESVATAASNTITTVSGQIADKTTDVEYDSVDADSISSEESTEER